MNAQNTLRNKDNPSYLVLHQTKEDKTRVKEAITTGKSSDIETISKSPDGIVKLLKAFNSGRTASCSQAPSDTQLQMFVIQSHAQCTSAHM